MKKIIFFVPAIIFILFYGFILYIGLTVLPFVFVWLSLLIVSGILLSMGKFWGGIFGMLPGFHLIYMSTIYTGQVIDIELQTGIIVATYFALCCIYVLYKKKKNNYYII